ncbi:MAG: hypothetical protein H0U76_21715 [Ktedonobacteraceae bacterium]|nr:hypothetical protein [Ktedonobacteraceae bacterium]
MQDVQGYGDYKGAYDNANDAVKNIDNRDVQGNLLADTYGKDRAYDSGSRILDTSILNADAGNSQKLKDTANQYTDLSSRFDKINGAINGNLTQAGSEFDANKKQVANTLGDVRNNIYSGVDSRIGSTSAELRKQAQVDSTNQRNEILSKYGADRSGVEGYLGGGGLVQDSYVSQNGQVGRGTVMNAEERARLSALGQLDGTQVESAQANPFAFDSARFKGDVEKAVTANNAEKSRVQAIQEAAAAKAAQDRADAAEREKQRDAGRVRIGQDGNVNIPTQAPHGDSYGSTKHKYL